MLGKFRGMVNAFRHDRSGVALTEFIVVLGLLIAGLLVVSILFGQGVHSGLSLWGQWINDVRNGFAWTAAP
ncbi:MAG: hypothetical protein AAFU41_18150 [Pseudomonadota bacterium]